MDPASYYLLWKGAHLKRFWRPLGIGKPCSNRPWITVSAILAYPQRQVNFPFRRGGSNSSRTHPSQRMRVQQPLRPLMVLMAGGLDPDRMENCHHQRHHGRMLWASRDGNQPFIHCKEGFRMTQSTWQRWGLRVTFPTSSLRLARSPRDKAYVSAHQSGQPVYKAFTWLWMQMPRNAPGSTAKTWVLIQMDTSGWYRLPCNPG